MSPVVCFLEDTSLKYRYETKYRTATIMEEDALNQLTAAGVLSSFIHNHLSCKHFLFVLPYLSLFCSLLLEADLALHKLSESPCGSLVIYVIPESSLLLPEV